jgi:hypothetical protein
MVNSLFFPEVDPSIQEGTQLWRVATKTANTYNSYLTMDMLFRYFPSVSFSGKYMTLFHQGTNSSNEGFSVVLKNNSADNTDISIGILTKSGTGNWTELSGSFVNLNSIGNINTDGYYIMFQYNYSGNNKIINFYVVTFNNSTIKTVPDFSFKTTTGPSIGTTSLNQWGFGSLPQALPKEANTTDGMYGYNNTNNYNGFIAQNVQVLYLRTWNPSTLIPSTSTTDGTYAMFNTENTDYSLYDLNKNQTPVPTSTANLNFQLSLPEFNDKLENIDNTQGNPGPTDVTTTTSTTNFQTLNPPNSYNFAVNTTGSLNIIETSEIPCLLKGTKVLTDKGYKNIEDIKIGEFVISHDNRRLKVIDTYHAYALKSNTIKSICIKKGVYDLGSDEKIEVLWDLRMSQDHSILINGEFIIGNQNKIFPFEYIENEHIFEFYGIRTNNWNTDSIIVNGIPVETWGGWNPLIKETSKLGDEAIFNENGNRILQIN